MLLYKHTIWLGRLLRIKTGMNHNPRVRGSSPCAAILQALVNQGLIFCESDLMTLNAPLWSVSRLSLAAYTKIAVLFGIETPSKNDGHIR